jgi:hypothetical protein
MKCVYLQHLDLLVELYNGSSFLRRTHCLSCDSVTSSFYDLIASPGVDEDCKHDDFNQCFTPGHLITSCSRRFVLRFSPFVTYSDSGLKHFNGIN